MLTDDELNQLLDMRLDEFEARLAKDFPRYNYYPASARLGLLDMAFNLGNWGLVNKFPSLTRAAKAEDWAECRAPCTRRGISDSRNEEVEALFEECSRLPGTGNFLHQQSIALIGETIEFRSTPWAG
jgi:hypothetical protein